LMALTISAEMHKLWSFSIPLYIFTIITLRDLVLFL
jgi:hypothetical protein